MSAVGAIVGLSMIASAVGRLTYRRRRLRAFAEQYRRVRDQSTATATYAPATEAQSEARDASAGEVPRGVTVLGDIAQTRAGQPLLVLRCFVDAAGTTFGCVATTSGTPMMRLYSADATSVYTTFAMWQRPISPPSAPFVKNSFISSSEGRAHSLELHQKQMAKTNDLRAFHTVDELCTFLTETSKRIVEWRASQTPDALLEYDLRQLLGSRYDRYAPALARHLKLELPRARLLP